MSEDARELLAYLDRCWAAGIKPDHRRDLWMSTARAVAAHREFEANGIRLDGTESGPKRPPSVFDDYGRRLCGEYYVAANGAIVRCALPANS